MVVNPTDTENLMIAIAKHIPSAMERIITPQRELNIKALYSYFFELNRRIEVAYTKRYELVHESKIEEPFETN